MAHYNHLDVINKIGEVRDTVKTNQFSREDTYEMFLYARQLQRELAAQLEENFPPEALDD